MRVTHLGHACLLVEMADRRLLIDPGNFSSGYDDLRGLDAILVTHNHPDHFDPDRAPAFLRANTGVPVHADPLTAEQLRADGIPAVPTAEGTEFAVGDVTVTPVGRLHAFNHRKMPVIPNVGVVLRAPGEPSLFHPGDAYDAEPGQVDVLAHPLNAPWTASRDSIEFVARIAPRHVVPIHDALLSGRGRSMYAGHIQNFAEVDGLTLHQLGDAESATF